MKLSDLCEIKTNFPTADFWLVRRGKLEEVGKPIRTFSAEAIGVKVTATDKLVPDYLRYWFEFAQGNGLFLTMATGATNVKHITVQMVANIPIDLK